MAVIVLYTPLGFLYGDQRLVVIPVIATHRLLRGNQSLVVVMLYTALGFPCGDQRLVVVVFYAALGFLRDGCHSVLLHSVLHLRLHRESPLLFGSV